MNCCNAFSATSVSLGSPQPAFDNYSRHVAAITLHFQRLPTELHPDQVKDYLYQVKQRCNITKGRRPALRLHALTC